MKTPDGLEIGQEYSLYRISPNTGKITVVFNRIKLIDVSKHWSGVDQFEFDFVLKKDAAKHRHGAFALTLQSFTDTHVLQHLIK